jgi:hypothetical protein
MQQKCKRLLQPAWQQKSGLPDVNFRQAAPFSIRITLLISVSH